ncbi:MAG: ABC transporter ATP-binding protein [Desulfobulbaceae bacterium]
MHSFERLRKLHRILPHFRKTLQLIWRAAPAWTLAWLILIGVQGLLPVGVVYLTRSIVDTLAEAMGAGGNFASFSPLLPPAILLGTLLVAMTVIRSAHSLVRQNQSLMVEEAIYSLIHEKSTALDLSFYESSDYFDRLFLAREEAAHRPLELVDSLGSLLQNGLTLVAMAFVLLRYNLWAPIALLVATLPLLYVVFVYRQRQYRWSRDNTVRKRRALYYDWLITGRESAGELRLFGTGDHFREAFLAIREELRKGSLRINRSRVLAELAAALFALAVTGGAMAMMAWRVVAGAATLGDMALFYQAFNQGQQLLRSLLESMGQVYGSSLFLEDFFDFLKLKPRVTAPEKAIELPDPDRIDIRFENVSFRYPGMEQPILEDFTLELRSGVVTAIVGENGAGKSTLVKLLCRFYDPEAGKILFNGIDIRAMDPAEVRRHVTVLFQDPLRYNLPVRENIALGDLSTGYRENEIEKAMEASGFDRVCSRLPDGPETLLGRWFPGGMDLSGGEWQRLALARALYRNAPIVVLDEPTGSMDSWNELEWLRRFLSRVEKRTALIITHRFTTAMQADLIHVMDQGRIAESGSHAELLSAGGRYAASWRGQVGGRS